LDTLTNQRRKTWVETVENVQLRTAMRIISGALKATQILWLPTMSATASPYLTRKAATSIMHQCIESMNENIPLKKTVAHAPTATRLKSRRPFYNSEKQFDISSAWLDYWKNNLPTGGDVIEDPTVPLPGFHTATTHQWVTANRLSAKQAKTSQTLHQWGVSQNPKCPYGHAPKETVDHLFLTCPNTHIRGSYYTIQACGEDFQTCLKDINVNV